MVTGDKDSLQLITDHTMVKLVSTRMGQTTTKDMTETAFQEQYGFAPIHMIDLKALMGDSSDNIPGVPGIGEKTAMALIQQYESIDNLYAKMPDIEAKPAAIRKLAEGEESARESYWLATIVTDAPLDFHPEENLCRKPRPGRLPAVFLKLEFTKLIEKFGLSPAEQPAAERADFTMTVEQVTEPAQAERLLALWRAADHVSVLALPDLTGLSVVCRTGADTGVTAELFFDKYQGDWNALLNALFAADIRKVSHNVKDLMRTLLENGLPAEGFVFDTALAAYLLDATAGSYDLARLFVAYFNEELPKALYLEPDAFSLLGDAAAAGGQLRQLRRRRGRPVRRPGGKDWRSRARWTCCMRSEMPLCAVLAEMETAGCRVDAKALVAFGDLLARRAPSWNSRSTTWRGRNSTSTPPSSWGDPLWQAGPAPWQKDQDRLVHQCADVLEKLRYEAPIVGAVLEYRQYAKLKSTYADGLLKAMDPDGRVRTSFQMTVTATGRLSTEPNLQNIPTRTDLGSEIRRMFIPAEGCVLVDADYSQIELRLLAHMSGDEAMTPPSAPAGTSTPRRRPRCSTWRRTRMTHEMRRQAKAVNFGIVYGISAFSLSQDIGVSVAEAKAYMEAYFATFPGVRTYMDAIGGAGQGAGLCGDAVPPAAGPAGAEVLQLQPPLLRGAGGPEHAHPGHRGGHHEAGYGGGVETPAAGTAGGPSGAASPRRADRGVPGGPGGDRRGAAEGGDGERGVLSVP